MNIPDSKYKEYLKFASVITSGNRYEAEELVQDTILNICEKINSGKVIESKLNDNYIFIIMKNVFLNKKDKERVRKNISGNTLEFNDDIFDKYYELNASELDTIIFNDMIFQDKLNYISEMINKLPSYDRKLFVLHYICISWQTLLSQLHNKR